MKEAIVAPDTTVQIHDVAIPEPGPGELLVKVLVSGTNPKDWKLPFWLNITSNTGDDAAGLVHKIGPGVSGFSQGDRVAGFHVMRTPHGSFAEYAILPAYTTFHVPQRITLDEAATVPLAAYTAALAVHHDLRIPAPWEPPRDGPTPVLVYGASTAIGAYALKLLKRAAVHPVIAVGSKNSSFLTHLLDKDKGDAFIDYTAFDSPDKLADGLATALQRTGATTQLRAFDCVSENGTYEVLGKALAAASPADGPRPLLVVCLPGQDLNQMDPRVEVLTTSVGRVHKDEDGGQLFGAVWATALATGLKEGWLVPHPYESVQGLESLEIALKGLREGRVRGKKMVVRIAEGK